MGSQPVREGSVLWQPSEESKNRATITKYLRWLASERQLAFNDYHSLWQWSVTHIEDFWQSLWEFFDIKASKPYSHILSSRKMPGTRWFAGSELNYAEHVFRQMSSQRPALIFQSEIVPLTEMPWAELYRQVASVAAALRKLDVKRGDRVVAYMPNIPQTLIAFLACASIGATWSAVRLILVHAALSTALTRSDPGFCLLLTVINTAAKCLIFGRPPPNSDSRSGPWKKPFLFPI